MAEAIAVVGLIASIASLVDLSTKVVSRLQEFNSKSTDIPESFRSLSLRLPLLTSTLQDIESQAKTGHIPDSAAKALHAVVDSTSQYVSILQVQLKKVLPSEDASRLERASKALKSLAKENQIQQALEKIYKNNDILILYQTTRHVNTGERILEVLSKLNITSPTRSCPSSNIPFERDPDFVDRGTLTDQLLDKCGLSASWTVLVGLGGVG